MSYALILSDRSIYWNSFSKANNWKDALIIATSKKNRTACAKVKFTTYKVSKQLKIAKGERKQIKKQEICGLKFRKLFSKAQEEVHYWSLYNFYMLNIIMFFITKRKQLSSWFCEQIANELSNLTSRWLIIKWD